MTDVFQLMIDELRAAGCCHVDRFPKFYNSSIGAHLLNLHNQSQHVYFEARRIPNLREHVMFVAPPGGEKTFWQEQYLRGEQALLLDSGIGVGMKGMMTEAGFVGTIRLDQGQKVEVPGICKRNVNDIVGIEEFSAVTAALSADYAKTLDPALLGALDSGWVYKDLAAGDISYQTNLTLWCGTQPARFDLRSGMARRFLFIYFIPNGKDLTEIKKARRDSKNRRFDPIHTDRIRKELQVLKQHVRQIEKVTWDEEVYKVYDEHKLLHWEEQLYDHLIMGYLVMRGKFDHELHVTLDEYVRAMILEEAYYRDTIRRGSEFAEVLLIMREHSGEMGLFELKDELLSFGKDWRQSTDLINELVRMRAMVRTPDGKLRLSSQLRGEPSGRA